MRCPHCYTAPSAVRQTTRPLDEGLEEGDIKRRLRKCRNCQRMFTTFEIHEELFRRLRGVTEEGQKKTEERPRELKRHHLLFDEVASKKKKKPIKSRLTRLKESKND